MASMPVSIPLDFKVKGMGKIIRMLETLTTGMEIVVTNVERLGTTLENIQGDITSLKEAATTKADADAATIAQLRSDVTAATDRADLSDAQKAEVQAALDTATASLETAQADFDASLQPLVDRADEIDAQTPGAGGGETPPVEPEVPVEPTPEPEPVPVEPTPEPEPLPAEPAPAEPGAPAEGEVTP